MIYAGAYVTVSPTPTPMTAAVSSSSVTPSAVSVSWPMQARNWARRPPETMCVGLSSSGTEAVGVGHHRGAAVEDVDVVLEAETLVFEHAHRRAARIVRLAHDLPRAFGEQRGVDRVLGHEIGDELVAVARIELVGVAKAHVEEASGKAVPERRVAGIVDGAAQFGQRAVGELGAVGADEQANRWRCIAMNR